MIAEILALISTATAQQLTLAGGAAFVATTAIGWMLGKASNTRPYKAVRAAYGRALYGAGAGLSKMATLRFGAPIVEPLEGVAADFAGFGVEQFFAGLRSDNLRKLDKHLDRLQSVGSETRAKAIAQKMIEAVTEKAKAAPISQEEQEMLNRAMKAANHFTESRLLDANQKE